MSAHIAGELANWPTRLALLRSFALLGLRVQVGRYSLQVQDCSHFVFQEYGGDLGAPRLDADADTVDDMLRQGRIVSDALARAGIRHHFEIYDDLGKLSGYLHHEWPLEESAGPGVAPDRGGF